MRPPACSMSVGRWQTSKLLQVPAYSPCRADVHALGQWAPQLRFEDMKALPSLHTSICRSCHLPVQALQGHALPL